MVGVIEVSLLAAPKNLPSLDTQVEQVFDGVFSLDTHTRQKQAGMCHKSSKRVWVQIKRVDRRI